MKISKVKGRNRARAGSMAGSASGGIVGTFLAEYATLVRRTGIYVDRDGGLAMPIRSASNEMETPEEHIARLYREERLCPAEH